MKDTAEQVQKQDVQRAKPVRRPKTGTTVYVSLMGPFADGNGETEVLGVSSSRQAAWAINGIWHSKNLHEVGRTSQVLDFVLDAGGVE